MGMDVWVYAWVWVWFLVASHLFGENWCLLNVRVVVRVRVKSEAPLGVHIPPYTLTPKDPRTHTPVYRYTHTRIHPYTFTPKQP